MSTDYTPTTAEDWMPTDMQAAVAAKHENGEK